MVVLRLGAELTQLLRGAVQLYTIPVGWPVHKLALVRELCPCTHAYK